MHTSNIPNTPRSQTMAAWFLLALFAWCLASCKTTRQTSSSESSRNATSQTQWRYARLFSSDSICRLTALSFDSCRITFAMSGKTDIHEDAPSSYPPSSASSSLGKPQAQNKAKPSSSHAKPKAHNKAKPSTSKATTTPSPSSLTIYGLRFAQSDETKSVSQSTQSDSTSIEAQSSNDKSKQQTKACEPFTLFDKLTLIPILLIMAAAIIFFIHRYRSAK